jgi:L-fuculose-phosphate aldolase
MGAAIGMVAPTHPAILMQNHGAITWATDVERAYWKMENLDAYCQMLLLAKSAGMTVTEIDAQGIKKLSELIS